ncbi:MAG: hypothetical protein MZV64_43485 [Ignavibacteriales bacterium]|nr:hypothetical protein [Ignavibacteriales bacterium]
MLVSRIVKDRPALPTMVTGMADRRGRASCCWPPRTTPGCSSLGIAVFSIGEMTAHPKYYSFVGPGGAGRPQGRLHGLRVPLRRVRVAARLEPRRVPLRAHAEAGSRLAGSVRDDAHVLADVRGAGRRGGRRPDPVRAGVHGRHARTRGARPER